MFLKLTIEIIIFCKQQWATKLAPTLTYSHINLIDKVNINYICVFFPFHFLSRLVNISKSNILNENIAIRVYVMFMFKYILREMKV